MVFADTKRISRANVTRQRSAQVNNALGIEPVESQEPTENFATHVRKANIGKPVTRLRRDITVPPQCSISHEGFKVPPATPKTTRFPGWKLGSGFEGINFDTTHGKGSIRSYKGKSKRLKTPRFTRPCLRPLELTTESSPTERKLRPKWQLETGASAVPPEQHTRVTSEQSSEEAPEAEARPIIDEAAADSEVLRTQVQTLATLLRPPNEARNPETSGRSQTASTPVRMVLGREEALAIRKDDLDSSPSIRQPSKSERNGWLKRRRKVSFADINDLGPQERVVEESQEDLRENTEDPFEAHNAVWYNETQPKSPLQDFAHEKSHTFQGEAIEEGEDILDNSPSQNASYPKSQVFSGSLKDTAPRAGGSPTKFPRRSIMRAPSSQFQIATSSRPLEVQNSQEQRDMRRSAKKPAPNSRRTTKRQADGLFSDDERDFRHIEETWPESVDLDRHTKYVLPEACLGGGRYFSNAVQQLSSPEKGLQSVPRRKSHTTKHYGSNEQKENIRVGFETHEGAHHVSVSPTKRQRPSQAEQGSLELGMTPRLRRTMSSVPFKPPFKDLV